MFEPGHLHRASIPGLPNQPEFSIDLYYEVRRDAEEGTMLHFRMVGVINGVSFEETFELHRDTAFNFASVATRIANKHGLHTSVGPIVHNHQEFDAMFEDIRQKLRAEPGEPVNLDHLQKDGL
ncbi:DUF5064 family protein [Pseudomonas otitidis]|uniref:DUF5064 family protein n=1 Tax=Metapseudomonas otitidis TaxID=319939 RepID=UPI00244CC843|nr:DUF5064 family protein [Pseudomonas otitidis]MDH1106538.1 DUF5064 family protein [Pseudomonas otitidis]MDH1157648.1 DUF5064 family protein [Pseudomonas otitidis]MDH1162722.1 DUF5064 family protein [Pseudomonas otitidis]